MFIAISLVLVITSFILGRLTSSARFLKNDPVWLQEQLNILNIVQDTPLNTTPTLDSVDAVKDTLETTNKRIISIFEEYLLERISSGTYSYSQTAKEFHYVSRENLIKLLNTVRYNYKQKGISLDMELLSRGGANYVKVEVHLNA